MTKILILGDSLVADHDWQACMPFFKVDNLGVPGATATDLLASLPDIITWIASSDVIVVMIGTNDLLLGNDNFVTQLKNILIQLSHNCPTAEILVTSLLPMDLPNLPHNSVVSLNTRVEAITMRTGCCFLDIHKRFVGSDKKLFQEDGVHLTTTAYALWERALLEHIAFLVEND